ncbi:MULTISPECIES: transcriptional regulator [unclassified Mycolicibacterium]|uniref:transcriptional regulator n=1 Tax=unclassified Mycolicibacterium TaxID=2636767 RepID=UPI0012DE5C5D|nr:MULTISPECIES: transcriptional regulator [unclassified Mycolicibacterium]MUL82867.1 helix-turn-helix domain-containing protein [Mycolicibacterium sp. CBMA 329]MUL89202.1 helix-turn-helix domain-containing protein [Mycolicibacterium sp. CBMA 331]MUL97769.1 helix-turn-helix domain-containing protein [Mycolicibacterium sp. CBMA 334]MUM25118.1 helix-turn-helix domain-containing protein [Mycolicibacterium sp. CBMA 295]MUM38718.1 helix-turn-helix domain-containing protein [Mycolicibacterium sp. CB
MTDAEYDLATGEFDVGLIRAGSAAAARRRELDISQRSLAADGIINAGALIAFEKGRSWPRERTRLKLEEVLRWPPGTIARLRQGGPVPDPAMPAPARVEMPTVVNARSAAAPLTTTAPASDEVPLIAQAVLTAVHTLESTISTLPAVGEPEFTPRVTSVLADLRQLEAVASRAARLSMVTPALIKALSAVRRQIDELTTRAASAPGATLGQRLYAARRQSNLTIGETATAAGVSEDTVARAEAEYPVDASAVHALEALIGAMR